jgi:DNA-binding NarL/FixJ family response regulator
MCRFRWPESDEEMTMAIRVMVADDHTIMREGLKNLLRKEPDIEIVAEAANGRQALELSRKVPMDVVIMDISMKELNGIEATRRIREQNPAIKIIALSMHADKRYVAGMFNAGAAAYLLKDCDMDELIQAVRAVAANRSYICSAISSTVIRDYLRQMRQEDEPLLSARERETLQLLAEGHSTKQIASTLQVSVKTVETHRQRIMEKLDIFSVAELTKYAIREGLTTLET